MRRVEQSQDYVVYEVDDGGMAILCRSCYLVSHNQNDVENRYCGHCDRFLDPPAPGAGRLMCAMMGLGGGR